MHAAGRVCPSCGGGLREMEGQFETSEMIDVVELKHCAVEVKQQKYVCRCGGCVETAPGPDRGLVGSRYSLHFEIEVVIDEYLDHIPLERQVRILGRHGLVQSSDPARAPRRARYWRGGPKQSPRVDAKCSRDGRDDGGARVCTGGFELLHVAVR